MDSSIQNLVSILHQAHLDNAERVHFAKARRARQISTMPTTSFVYEFFIYNSIYQYDWTETHDRQILTPWPRDGELKEGKQQRELEKFLMTRCRTDNSILYRAFRPISYVDVSDNEWTRITPDARIKAEDGERFFRNIRKLQDILGDGKTSGSAKPSRDLFHLIGNCRYFIFLVRNNIFYGYKNIGDIYEPKQRRRLELYDLFLKCLTSMFFLALGRTEVASDYVQLPIIQHVGNSVIHCERSLVMEGVVTGILKPEDSRLLRTVGQCSSVEETPLERSTLFYPSAGTDIITPLLLALPYCREFCFYDISARRRGDWLLRDIKCYLGVQDAHIENTHREEDTVSFEVDGIRRLVRYVNRDNVDFLSDDGVLVYYYHRGDSWGEGGSGQRWDSELFPSLFRRMSPSTPCRFVTQGEPGGLHPALQKQSVSLILPISGHASDKTYYYGTFQL